MGHGLEGEAVLTQEPGIDGIAAGQLLDASCVQPQGVLRLRHHREPDTVESGDVLRGAGSVAPSLFAKGVRVDAGGVVPHNGGDALAQGGLSVPGGLTVEHDHLLLAEVTGEGVAQPPLHEVQRVRVIGENLLHEALPSLAPRIRVIDHTALPGQHIRRVMGPKLPIVEIQCPVHHVEQPGVPVKFTALYGPHRRRVSDIGPPGVVAAPPSRKAEPCLPPLVICDRCSIAGNCG